MAKSPFDKYGEAMRDAGKGLGRMGKRPIGGPGDALKKNKRGGRSNRKGGRH